MPTTKTTRKDRVTPENAVSTSQAQQNLSSILHSVGDGEHVYITHYGRPKAVLLSVAEYERLVDSAEVDLSALDQKFDAMVAEMQTPAQREGVDRLFKMTGEELGEAATSDPDGAD